MTAGSLGPAGPGPRLVWRAFDDLSRRELYGLLRLRQDVFVVEQACPFPEIDGRDPVALHLLAVADGRPDLAGCLRVLPPDTCGTAEAAIGRVATAAWARSTGLGRALMQEALAEIARRHGPVPVTVGAQTSVERFYAGLGFIRTGPDYDEDGIAHCRMVRGGTDL